MIPIRNDTPPTIAKGPSRIKVPEFTPSPEEERLRRELFRWRDNTAKEIYGDLDFYGADMFLHFSLIDRIVELAHVFKLNSVKDLVDQTRWDLAEEYGAEVITLVKECVPKLALPSPFTTAPLVPRNDHHTVISSRTVATNTSRPRAPPTCSVCGRVGHRSELFYVFTFLVLLSHKLGIENSNLCGNKLPRM